MKYPKKLFKGWAFAPLGALTALLGYPPVGIWPLALVGPALLWARATREDPFDASMRGLWYGLGFFTALIYWLVNTLAHYGGLPLPVSVFALFLLVSYLALYPALAARIISLAGRKTVDGALILAPFIWTGLEWIRARLMSGFGWGDIPLAFWNQGFALDLAPRIGADGAGLLLAMAASLIAWLYLRKTNGNEKPGTRSLVPALLGITLIITLPLVPDGLGEKTVPARILIVQGNIEQSLKWDFDNRAQTINTYRRLTLDALKKEPHDAVLWPETAFPSYYQDPSPFRETVEDLARKAATPIIFGAPAYVTEEGRRKMRNSVYALTPEGKITGRYDKMHLVPFGEYVPLGKLLVFVKRLVYAAGDFTPGEKTVTLGTETGAPRAGPLVCFESIFPDYALEHAQNGAGYLALVTNDAWFGRTSAPWQHLGYAAWRAAETGLPLARAANTGVSAFFDRRGRLITTAPFEKEATLSTVLQCPSGTNPLQASIRPCIGPLSLTLAAAGLFAILRAPGKKRIKENGR